MYNAKDFSMAQLVAAQEAATAAKLTVLSQWMSKEEAARAEEEISRLRKTQEYIETRLELGLPLNMVNVLDGILE